MVQLSAKRPYVLRVEWAHCASSRLIISGAGRPGKFMMYSQLPAVQSVQWEEATSAECPVGRGEVLKHRFPLSAKA